MESTFGTMPFRAHWVRHVGIARSMPDDMITSDPLKTSEGFAFAGVLNFKFPKIFSSASELRVLALRGPKPPAKVESTHEYAMSTDTGIGYTVYTHRDDVMTHSTLIL